MTGRNLAVIKVGGSLLDWSELPGRLIAYLDARHLTDDGERAVLIAGGGAGVDWIRRLDQIHGLSSVAADKLAMHALDLTAAMLAELLAGSTTIDRLAMLEPALEERAITIMAPRRILAEIEEFGTGPLPASWDVTSDTIAARIAAHLESRTLVLLKSAPLLDCATRQDAARLGLVDPMLPSVARLIPQVEYVNLRGQPLDRRFLAT
jgi:5-(aminomethyl)-3-furanmethanol phosphate kinase